MKVRPVTQSEWNSLNQFNTSHMIWAVRNSLAAHVAEGLGDCPAAVAMRTFLPLANAHFALHKQVVNNRGKPANVTLGESDRRVDGTYSRFHTGIEEQVKTFGEDSARGQAATRMLEGPLNQPIRSVTQVERVEQEVLLKTIIAEIEAEHLDDVRTLGLEDHFELLKEHTEAFVREMTLDAQQKNLPSLSQIEEERKYLQACMIGCINRVMGAYPDPTEDDLRMRSILLSPFAIQNDAISRFHRQRRGRGNPTPPDIDLETGSELVAELPAPQPVTPTPVVADEPVEA